MKNTHYLKRLFREESGQDLIEYGLLAALISLAVVTVMGTIGSSLKAVFSDINAKL